MRESIRQKEEEIRSLQRKYEDELEKKADLRIEEQAKHKQVQEKLQFEIDFLKKELEQQMRGREMQYQYQQRRNISNPTATAPMVNNFTMGNNPAESAHQTILSNRANQIDKQPSQPSPYLNQFVRSNYKKTGGPSLNDSLDRLKLDFMQGYNEVMEESNAAYRLETLTQKKATGNGALAQMLQVGAGGQNPQVELQLVKEENEALKQVIAQMKVDMQAIVEKVKDTVQEQVKDRTNGVEDPQKDAKIWELNQKLQRKEEQINRLKEERDRLIQISNDLRADLNRSQRLVNDLMSQQMQAPSEAPIHVHAMNEDKMVTPRDKMQMQVQQSNDYVFKIGGDGQHERTPPFDMFAHNLRMSTENPGSYSPPNVRSG